MEVGSVMMSALGVESPEMTDTEIEAGVNGEDLPLWQAREAMRHAEIRLGSQATTLQSFETRATSILGWGALIITAFSGGIVVSLDKSQIWRAMALGVAIVPAVSAAIFSSRMLWPKKWAVVGYDPITVRSAPCESELDEIQWLNSGYAIGIADNAAFLNAAGTYFRLAWWALLASPIVAGATVIVIWILGW